MSLFSMVSGLFGAAGKGIGDAFNAAQAADDAERMVSDACGKYGNEGQKVILEKVQPDWNEYTRICIFILEYPDLDTYLEMTNHPDAIREIGEDLTDQVSQYIDELIEESGG